MSLRVLICGSRDWTDAAKIAYVLTHMPRDRVIIHGAARGADSLAAEVATELGFTCEAFPADWSQGRAAGAIRNRQMLNSGIDGVIAFVLRSPSPGTADCVGEAIRRGVHVKLVYP